MKDITLGQFHSGNSILHRLDVRFKLYFLLVFSLCALFTHTWAGLSLCAVVGIAAFLLSQFPLKRIWRQIRGVFFLFAFFSLIPLFATKGHTLFRLGFLVVTQEGFKTAVFLVVRFTFIAVIAVLVTGTTLPSDILDGLTEAFPISNEFAMTLVLALTFLPILGEELNRIRTAQAARGVDFYDDDFLTRMKSIADLIAPLFLAAVNRSGRIAEALDIRCYDSKTKRSRLMPLKYQKYDYIGCGCLLVFTVGFIFLNGMI